MATGSRHGGAWDLGGRLHDLVLTAAGKAARATWAGMFVVEFSKKATLTQVRLTGSGLTSPSVPRSPFDLERFVSAQEAGGTYRRALAELRRGRKESHWMWFVFPQLAGLGKSAMSARYSISSLEEASAYLAHPVLGARLIECARVAAAAPAGASAEDVFGAVDALKLRSSMTLFLRASPEERAFAEVLGRWWEGVGDAATDTLLEGE